MDKDKKRREEREAAWVWLNVVAAKTEVGSWVPNCQLRVESV